MDRLRRAALVATLAVCALAACSEGGGAPPPASGGSGGGAGTGGEGGSAGSGGAPVEDRQAPTVTISSPANESYVDSLATEIRGTATDDVEVAGIEISLNRGAFRPVPVVPAQRVDFAIPVELRPTHDTVILRVTDAAGRSSTAGVAFDAPGPPEIVAFQVDPPVVAAGEEVTITVQAAGTRPLSVWLEPIGDVTGRRTVTLRPTRTVNLLLEARNAEGVVRQPNRIDVQGGPLTVLPSGGVLLPGATQRFWVENLRSPDSDPVAWSDGTTGGPVLAWTAPDVPGTYEIAATSAADDPPRTATTRVEVRALAPPSLVRYEPLGGQARPGGTGSTLIVDDDGRLWLAGSAAGSVSYLQPGADAFEPRRVPLDILVAHLARDPATDTLYAASSFGGACAVGPGGATPLPELPGRLLGLRFSGNLYALVLVGGTERQIYRLDDQAWTPVGPALPRGFSSAGFLRRASGSWLAWTQLAHQTAGFLVEWTPGSDAWTPIATDRAIRDLAEAPDGSLYLAGVGVRQLQGGAQIERAEGLAAQTESIAVRGDTVYACAGNDVWRSTGGAFASLDHPAAGQPGACTVRTDARGGVHLAGTIGTWSWEEGSGWRPRGGGGLPTGISIAALAFGDDGTLAIASRGGPRALGHAPFHIREDGVWQTVPTNDGEGAADGSRIAWDGSAWYGIAQGTVYRIDRATHAATMLPALPEGAGPPANVVAREGVVVVSGREGAFRLAAGDAWEPLGGPAFLSSMAFDPAGNLWATGDRTVQVLRSPAFGWEERAASTFPYRSDANFFQIAAGRDGTMWATTSDGPVRLAPGEGSWQLAGLGAFQSPFDRVHRVAAGSHIWAIGRSGLYELAPEGAWIPVDVGLPPFDADDFAAGPDGALYVVSRDLGLIRLLPAEAP